MENSHRGALNALLFFALAVLLSWLLLYTGIWALVAIAGIAAGVLTGIRYLPSFALGLAAGTIASLVWLFPAVAPGASGYVSAVGSLASIPGYLLLALSFIITALFVGSGGVLGSWARKSFYRGKKTG